MIIINTIEKDFKIKRSNSIRYNKYNLKETQERSEKEYNLLMKRMLKEE